MATHYNRMRAQADQRAAKLIKTGAGRTARTRKLAVSVLKYGTVDNVNALKRKIPNPK